MVPSDPLEVFVPTALVLVLAVSLLASGSAAAAWGWSEATRPPTPIPVGNAVLTDPAVAGGTLAHALDAVWGWLLGFAALAVGLGVIASAMRLFVIGSAPRRHSGESNFV